MNVPEPIGPFGVLLTEEERRRFLALSRRATYDRGDAVFREGGVTRHAVLIETGSVKIVRKRPDGGDMILAVRGPSDLIGEMAAIDGTPRSASAVAMSPLTGHVIEAHNFEAFVKENPGVAWVLIRSMAERQRDADQRRLSQASSSVAHRVAAELLDMAEREVGLAGDGGFVVSQAELAETVGATREAVAKALGELRRAGAIATARRSMTILKRELLLAQMRD